MLVTVRVGGPGKMVVVLVSVSVVRCPLREVTIVDRTVLTRPEPEM